MYRNKVEAPVKFDQYAVEGDLLMSVGQKRFYISDQCDQAREQLQSLVDSGKYDTNSSYYATSSLPFIERHLYYLSLHPTLELGGYISNLKLMTRIRST